jgi:23S rRNA (adenine2503-C2)-methyltransferase
MSEPHAPEEPFLGATPRPALRPPLRDAEGRVDLRSLERAELERFLVDELEETPGRALRVFKALWQHGATSIDDLPGVGKAVRAKLAKRAFLSELVPATVQHSEDGTTKYLWRLADGYTIESVLIPDDGRLTLCMSSQVGCAMACSFCLTGDMGLKRHLRPSEIALQPLRVAQGLPQGVRITNLVLMGMGEPLHNLDNLVTALRICMDDHGLNLSHRKITVSTVGLAPQLAELAARLPVNLAVSINASHDAQRKQIMPITRKHSLAELMEACRRFPLDRGRRITFEYVMFDGFNDTEADAERLLALLEGVPSKLNLIPYNPNPDRALMPPPMERVRAFQHWFVTRGVACSVRSTRGQDISAACGQLGKAGAPKAARDIVAG